MADSGEIAANTWRPAIGRDRQQVDGRRIDRKLDLILQLPAHHFSGFVGRTGDRVGLDELVLAVAEQCGAAVTIEVHRLFQRDQRRLVVSAFLDRVGQKHLGLASRVAAHMHEIDAPFPHRDGQPACFGLWFKQVWHWTHRHPFFADYTNRRR
jgi:hypothetical protein